MVIMTFAFNGGRGLACVVWHAENPRVSIQNASTCTFKTSPCVPAPRAHVEKFLNLHTHGREREEGGGRRQFRLPKFAHVWLSSASEVHQK